jgi:molecular chaperone DnaK
MSQERLSAEFLVNECDVVLELCAFLIPQPQQERLQKLSQELLMAINANNLSLMESKSEDARRELDNLPDEVILIQASLSAIRQANRVAPTQANAMSDKLFRMLGALESSDAREADRLWSELQPEVKRWLNQELPSNTIVTGLKR